MQSKYGGMEAADIGRLPELLEKDRCLREAYADAVAGDNALKDVNSFSSASTTRSVFLLPNAILSKSVIHRDRAHGSEG